MGRMWTLQRAQALRPETEWLCADAQGTRAQNGTSGQSVAGGQAGGVLPLKRSTLQRAPAQAGTMRSWCPPQGLACEHPGHAGVERSVLSASETRHRRGPRQPATPRHWPWASCSQPHQHQGGPLSWARKNRKPSTEPIPAPEQNPSLNFCLKTTLCQPKCGHLRRKCKSSR